MRRITSPNRNLAPDQISLHVYSRHDASCPCLDNFCAKHAYERERARAAGQRRVESPFDRCKPKDRSESLAIRRTCSACNVWSYLNVEHRSSHQHEKCAHCPRFTWRKPSIIWHHPKVLCSLSVPSSSTFELVYAADLFYGASSFNESLANWDVSSVTDMTGKPHAARIARELARLAILLRRYRYVPKSIRLQPALEQMECEQRHVHGKYAVASSSTLRHTCLLTPPRHVL